MLTASSPAKLNLALVVGPRRADGKHEVVTVTEKLALADTIGVEPADEHVVEGFDDDTLVLAALTSISAASGDAGGFRATIEKQIPVAAGLGGGSSDAATALRLANALLPRPLPDDRVHELATAIGADVPLFLRRGAQLGSGDGTTLEMVVLPCDYHVVLWLPVGSAKRSTAGVYRRFDERHGDDGFEGRRRALLDALRSVRDAGDLASLPPNDLATSPDAERLRERGAFRADVSGAGPVLYGLFEKLDIAARAAAELSQRGRTWLTTVVTDA
jgi:4-diphosphocytidyl-2-C-methyl-D-erythritol kinase